MCERERRGGGGEEEGEIYLFQNRFDFAIKTLRQTDREMKNQEKRWISNNIRNTMGPSLVFKKSTLLIQQLQLQQ